jgi:putative CocE/NonD family hydrolase
VSEAAESSIGIEFDVAATMRDGVVLACDVYRPGTARGSWPTLVVRTPYGKGLLLENAWNGLDPVAAARSGFLVVIQDTRGRFRSEGDWDPLRDDGEDGVDSVAWAARLPGSNGRVGMFGGSYCGNTQWQAALGGAPALQAIAPLMTWADPADGLYSRGGATELGSSLPWALVTGADDVARRLLEPMLGHRVEAIIDDLDRLSERGFRRSTAEHGEMLRRHDVREVGTLRVAAGGAIDHDPADISGRQPCIGIPTFHTGGWYDIFLQGTLDNYQAMVEEGLEARLVIGPWTHLDFGDAAGELSFGARASRESPAVHPAGRWAEVQLAWFRRHLDPHPETERSADDPPIRIFVMGRNEWRSESVWPPPDVKESKWFLRPEGVLSPRAVVDDHPPIAYAYDLSDPVPTVGGHTLITAAFPAGPMDQREVESRSDVITFTSDPLTADLEVAGRIYAHMHATSSASSADWVVRLCDVHPDGRSINVCDGVVRVGDAQSVDPLTVDLWSTSMVFLAGHRIRVDVANSSFPRWDRPPARNATPSYSPTAAQVFVDGRRPSFVVLPVRGPWT